MTKTRTHYNRVLGATFMVVAFFAFAQGAAAAAIDPQQEFENTLKEAQLVAPDSAGVISPEAAIGVVINNLLIYSGVAILALIVVSGIMWATAAGNEERIKRAKRILTGSVIGLVLIFSAAVVTNFILSQLQNVIQ